MNKQKGFTIIELIVVIAIIAVLAAIVMVNVTQYIGKSKDAAITANLDTIRTNAGIWYADAAHSTSYSGFVTSSDYTTAASAIGTAGGALTTDFTTSTTAYCVSSTLVSGKIAGTPGTGHWCISSDNFSGRGTCAASACTPETPL